MFIFKDTQKRTVLSGNKRFHNFVVNMTERYLEGHLPDFSRSKHNGTSKLKKKKHGKPCHLPSSFGCWDHFWSYIHMWCWVRKSTIYSQLSFFKELYFKQTLFSHKWYTFLHGAPQKLLSLDSVVLHCMFSVCLSV